MQEDASYAVKIGIGNSRNMPTDFISTSTAFVASPHHHLATSARSSPHLACSGAATYVHQTQLRASSSAFCACVSTFLVDLEPLVRCVNGLTCVDRSRFSQVTVLQWTSRSDQTCRLAHASVHTHPVTQPSYLLTYLLRTLTVRRERTWPKRTVSSRTLIVLCFRIF